MQERCGEAFMDCFGKVRREESGPVACMLEVRNR